MEQQQEYRFQFNSGEVVVKIPPLFTVEEPVGGMVLEQEAPPTRGPVTPVFYVPAPDDPTRAAIVALARSHWSEMFQKGDRRTWYHENVKHVAINYWAPKQPAGVTVQELLKEENLLIATRELWMARLAGAGAGPGIVLDTVGEGTPGYRHEWKGTGDFNQWANSILSKLRRTEIDGVSLLAPYEPPVTQGGFKRLPTGELVANG